jgi:hypothetical protein
MIYIEETQIYIHMIELIRKERKIPLLNLIEGITSERSYRRYLSESKDVPLNVLEKLMHTLNVSVMDMIIFTLQVESKPSGVIELIQYTYHKAYELAKPFQESLTHYTNDKKDLNTIVSYFVHLYLFKTSLDDSTFNNYLNTLKEIEVDNKTQLEGFSLYVIKHIHFQKQIDPFIHETFLKGNLHLYQIVLYAQIFDMYLLHYIDTAYFDIETYKTLSDHMYRVSNLWLDSYNIYSSHLHMAYQYYLSGDEVHACKHVFAYLNLYILTQSKKLDVRVEILIKKIISKDIQTFMTTYPSIQSF